LKFAPVDRNYAETDNMRVPLVCLAASLGFVLAANSFVYRFHDEKAVCVMLGICLFFILFIPMRAGFLEDNRHLAVSVGLALVAVSVRLFMFSFKSGDYNSFLNHWVQFFRDNGGFKAIGEPIGDYNFPYLYFMALFSYLPINDLFLIKILSVVFDIAAAFFAYKLVGLLTENKRVQFGVYFAVLLLPTVVLNSGKWAQCDSIYAAFAFAALYFGLKKRPVLTVLFAALSFSFKLQAIFVMPIVVIFLLRGNIKAKHLLLFPAFYVLTALPAVIAGRPVADLVLIYTNQVGTYSSRLTLNAPTLFALWKAPEGVTQPYSFVGIFLALALMVSILTVAFLNKDKLNDRNTLMIALAMSVGIPFFLPSMHERYFYIPEILSIILVAGTAKHLLLPLVIQFSSWICYDAYLTGVYRLELFFAAILMALATLWACYAVYREFYEKAAPVLVGGVPDEILEDKPDSPVENGANDVTGGNAGIN